MEDVVSIDEKVVGVGNSEVHVTLKGKKRCKLKQTDDTIVERAIYLTKVARGL